MQRIRHLIREIHRRSLWQVLGIYLGGSWLAYQVILNLTQGIGLPEWVPGFAVVLFIIGLPVVLATAFVQEGGPLAPAAAESGGQRAGIRRGGGRSPVRRGGELLTWRRALSAGALAFVLLGVSAAGYLGARRAGIGPFGSLMAAGVIDAREPVIVADFEPVGSDSLLAAALTTAFRVGLAQSHAIMVLEPARVAESLARMGRSTAEPLTPAVARELAMREGIRAVVTGEVAHAGGRYLVSVGLVRTSDGGAIATFQEHARDDAALIPTVDRLAKRLRERAGESLRRVHATPALAVVTTPSLAALRKYTQASTAYDVHGERELAITLLREAVELDSAFAMAWRKLAVVYNAASFGRTLADVAATRAWELRERLTETERYAAMAYYHMSVTGDYGAAIAAYRAWAAAFPADYGPWNNLGIIYTHEGEYAEAAAALERAIELDPTRSQPYANIMFAYVALGRFDDAERNLAHFIDRFGETPQAMRLLAQLAAARGDFDAAERYAGRMVELAGTSSFYRADAAHWHAQIALARGRLREADRLRQHALQLHVQRGASTAAGFQSFMLSTSYAVPRGDTSSALRYLRETLTSGWYATTPPTDRPYALFAAAAAFSGDTALAGSLLADLAAENPPQDPADNAFGSLARGFMDLAGRRYDEGIRTLRSIDRIAACTACPLPFIALAWDRGGVADSALAVYERYVRTHDFDRVIIDGHFLAPAYERLAELYAERGDAPRAAEYAARFVDLWHDADAELQPRVAAKRSYLDGRR